jgi:hypothetical protein
MCFEAKKSKQNSEKKIFEAKKSKQNSEKSVLKQQIWSEIAKKKF